MIVLLWESNGVWQLLTGYVRLHSPETSSQSKMVRYNLYTRKYIVCEC